MFFVHIFFNGVRLLGAYWNVVCGKTKRIAEMKGLIILRVLSGLGEGTMYAGLTDLLAAWVPLNERTTLGSLAYGGSTVISIPHMYTHNSIAFHTHKHQLQSPPSIHRSCLIYAFSILARIYPKHYMKRVKLSTIPLRNKVPYVVEYLILTMITIDLYLLLDLLLFLSILLSDDNKFSAA